MPRTPLIVVTALLLAVGVVPASARARHHHHHQAATRTSGSARGRVAPVSHAGIPQSTNIERLNDLSLRRAHAGESTTRPLAPPLAQ